MFSLLLNHSVFQYPRKEDIEEPVIDEYVSIKEYTNASWMQTNYNYLNTRLETNSNLKIAFLTDIHVGMGTKATWDVTKLDSNFKNYHNSTSMINRVKRALVVLHNLKDKINFTVYGGDYINNPYNSNYKDSVLQGFCLLGEVMRSSAKDTPTAILVGNHDLNTIHSGSTLGDYLSRVITLKELVETFNVPKNSNIVYGDDLCTYGYFDDTTNKIRCLFLNLYELAQELTASTTDTYNPQHRVWYSQRLIDFIINSLKFTESGWSVCIFSHQSIDDNAWMGCSKIADTVYNNNSRLIVLFAQRYLRDIILDIFIAFKHKLKINKSYKDGTIVINCDYTSNKSNDLIANFHGHNHDTNWRLIVYTIKDGIIVHRDPYSGNTDKISPSITTEQFLSYNAGRLALADYYNYVPFKSYLEAHPNWVEGAFNADIQSCTRYAIACISFPSMLNNPVTPTGHKYIPSYTYVNSSEKETAFDIIEIDRKNNLIYTHRYGTGASRKFSYYSGARGYWLDTKSSLTITVKQNSTALSGAKVELLFNGCTLNCGTTNSSGQIKYTPTNTVPFDTCTYRVTYNDEIIKTGKITNWNFTTININI